MRGLGQERVGVRWVFGWEGFFVVGLLVLVLVVLGGVFFFRGGGGIVFLFVFLGGGGGRTRKGESEMGVWALSTAGKRTSNS